MAEVEVRLSSAGGHACCGAQGKSNVVRMKAQNGIGAAVGDQVMLETISAESLGILLIILLIPFVLFITGYTLFTPWGGLLTLPGLFLSWWLGRITAKSRQAHIISLTK